jgi:uncharacterized delta-60 repeat protein
MLYKLESSMNGLALKAMTVRSCAHTGRAFLAALLAVIAAAAMAQVPGSLDSSFAVGGKFTNLAIGSASDDGRVIALQSDGKIVMAGSCAIGGVEKFCLARLNPNGTLDPDFDGPDALNPGNGKFAFAFTDSFDLATALRVQSDGKIIVAGRCKTGANYDFCIARLLPTGAFDTSFNAAGGAMAGKLVVSFGANNNTSEFGAIALQADGKIVMAGACDGVSNQDFCLVRLNTDGTFDENFDGPGTTPGNGKFRLAVGAGIDRAAAIAVQPDGKLIIAGTCVTDFCFVRLETNGDLDASFDGPLGTGDGKFSVAIGNSTDTLRAITLQPDGKIVAVGECYASPTLVKMCVARLLENGALDTAFDGPDPVGAPADGKFLLSFTPDSNEARAVFMQPDGKIVVVGSCWNVNNFDACLARLNGDGSLDTSFDGNDPLLPGNGKFLLSLVPGDETMYASAQQADGKIVIAGGCTSASNRDFCIARLQGGPFGAQHCTLDLDGDGIVSATTDTLIFNRVMRGMRDAAVINGISFPANATRNTWPLIRDYLVMQCGMSVY